ncbi:MAG: hypothetical protein BWY71_01107 [Planctomycetes bacterium ADurb.Bin412]|nr:MAG: hypothetical protein BWY71_01107 [Planctomycetes bacterium ADurb.Bin412]
MIPFCSRRIAKTIAITQLASAGQFIISFFFEAQNCVKPIRGKIQCSVKTMAPTGISSRP